MRLIHHQQRDATRIVQHIDELALLQLLRRDIDQLRDSLVDHLVRLLDLSLRQRRIDLLHSNVSLRGLLLLVLHQRDQRAHHDHRPRQKQRRQLVGEALAGAGRH